MGTERYHPLFADDLRMACSHYDLISHALGARFRSNVRSAIEQIVSRPESFGRIGGDFRGAMIEKFPYVIVFTKAESVVMLFGIRHAASDRSDWFNRSLSN